MKKVMLLILCLAAMTGNKAQAQEKTRPMDNMKTPMDSIPRDNMRTPMDNMKMPMDNMPMKMDTTPPNMRMRMDSTPPNMPTKTMPNSDIRPDRVYDNKIDKTANRMNRDTMINGTMQRNDELKGMYNGQRIRSDTIRNGVSSYKADDKSDNKMKSKAKNKKAMDGTQNGKYNSEMSRDSMPNGKYGDKMKRQQMPNGKMQDKMNRDSMPNGKYGDKERQRMAAENRSVMMHDGKVMIVRNGRMTVVKAFTNLNRGVKVMSDGTIVRQDGTKTMLKEGESVNMMGEIMPKKQ